MSSKLQSDLIEHSANRASLYNLLSSLYLYELTAHQATCFARQDFSLLKGTDELMDDGIDLIGQYFAKAGADKRDVRQELACDYAHSILGATADERRMAIPYESIFTSANGLLMQDARDDIYRLYCAEHLGTPEGLDIPEDHLGLIFAFMAHLCQRYSTALQEGDLCEAHRLAELQKEVVENHLANWAEAYCDVLESVARTGFYRGLGIMTRGWVRLEAASINGVIADTEDASALMHVEAKAAR